MIGYPRLVRLNPNIPWKTRGNGAVCIQVDHGTSENRLAGMLGKKPLYTFSKMASSLTDAEEQRVRACVIELVQSFSCVEDEKTNPGVVFLRNRPDVWVYHQTVSQVVSLEYILRVLAELEASYWGMKQKRGLIGATAACAWPAGKDWTYEVICYRQKERWGTERFVDDKSVIAMDLQLSSTFDNYDYQHHHLRVMPNSPCPILYGVRGDDETIIQAVEMIKSESVESWILFQTNQATDDHLRRSSVQEIQPYQSVIVKGKVTQHPKTLHGGHVIFSISDATGEIAVAAYEPTKEFRDVVRKLVIGDEVIVFGGIRSDPLTINLEKLEITTLRTVMCKVENPICPTCGKHMKSKGAHQGFICRRCHTTSITPVVKKTDRNITEGVYEVPVCARRHLSKPIQRMKKKSHVSQGSIV